MAAVAVNLTGLEVTPSLPSSLLIEIQWIGPTRELIRRSATVKLRAANVEIVHVRTLDTDVSGVAFGVSAIATDLQGGPIDGPVSISLVDIRKDIKQQVERTGHDVLQAVAKEPLNGKVLKTCESSSDKGDECRFQLEDMGRFALESCVEDKDGNRACFRTFLGKNKTEWKENPWGDFIDIKLLRVSDGVVKVGDTVEFQIENIYKDASALVMWGSSLGLDKKVIPLPDKQLASISVPVDETCAAGCSALVHINVPRQEEVDVNPHGIPSTIYYDPAMPRTVTLQEEIRVGQDRIVGVELLFPDLEIPPGEDTPIMAPQDATPISVSVGPCPGAEEPLSCNLSDGEDVEFTVVAVDKAVLELVPYELKDMALDFVFHLALSFDVVSSSEYLHAPGAITALVKRFMKEQEDNPWAVIDNLIHVPGYTPRTGSGPLIVPLSLGSDDEGTNSTGPSAKPRARSFTAPPQNAEPSTPLPSALPEEAIRSQADFTAIPLFTTIGPVKGGFGTVDFTAPDNIGTFVVRAYAGTDKGRFGSTEAEVIVRRRLSLTPSSPRVVRVGDKFEAGVIVTVSGESASDVPVTVDLKIEDGSGDFLSVAGESQMEAVTDVDGQVEVRFVLEALALGEAAIFISADGGKGYKDALRLTVPVLGLQDAVAVATSFAIQATEGEGATAVEGLELPNALPGAGSIELLAGVGRLPAVLGHARQIMEADVKHSCPNDGSLELAHSGVPSVLQMYRLYTPDDGEELDPAAEELVAASEANFSIALANLAVGNLTHDEHGLRWWVACPPQRSKSNPLGRASIHMNAYGVWLAESLGALLQGTKRETFLDGSNTLQMLVDEYWRPALEAQLLSDASEERSGKNPRAIQLSTVALARLALGSAWTAPKGTDPQVVADLSMERLESEFDDLGMEGMAHVALTLLSSEGQDGMELVERAVAAWTSNIRVGARTAYIAACDGCAAPAGLMGNALALLAMTRAGAETGPFGEKLANYVASPPAGKFAYFANYIEKLAVMLALGEYDASRGSTDPDLELDVTSGEVSLLQAEFTSPQSPLAVSTTPWAALTQMPEPLEFSAEGTGEVTVAALLNFVPAEPLLFPSYRGIYVEQAIQLVNASSDFDEPMGAPLAAVPLGSIVIVTVQITAPDSVGATTVRVLMPGGLEPVDPNIAGTSLGVCSFLTSLSFAFDCPDQETLPSAVTFRYDSLSAGTHVLRVRAVAATPGTFGLPPTAAFLNSQPEVMGLSAAGSFEVCSNCEAVARGPAGGPKECPQDCSGSGLCDLDEGTCLCFDGFVGEDCSMLAEA
ncbi:unnamed protein product [Ostreobium quekettii]|uniref:EGF-like domain-containing protein n=1 Tax=Ostreobium quekettii TaxID=121088 RepID=A0A8S1JEM2_9CHLO|nr:unnamed protein product [Ostreobium quekettii]